MKKDIKIEGLTIDTTLPLENCRGCSAVRGQLTVVMRAMTNRETIGNLSARITCHPTLEKPNSRFMDITLTVGEESIDAGNLVRNWNRRRVHCMIR